MNRISLAVIVAIIAAALYLISGGNISFKHTPGYFGEADAVGSDEDAGARYNYELMMLRDPATGKIPAHIREKELAFAATLPNDGYISASGKSTAVSWQQRGPWNVGGRTRALGIDVNNENNLVAGSCSGGMWRSVNKGLSWHQTNFDNQCKSVSCLAQDTRPGHRNVWYYGSGEAYGASASETGAYYLGNGVYKSTDSGETWTVLTATTSANPTSFDVWGDLVWNIAVNPVDGAVYAAAYGAIYKSLDGGASWLLVLGAFSSSYFTDVAISSTGVIYATLSSESSSRGIFRSADGITFKNITPPGFPTTYNRIKIGISPSDPSQVYFLGNTPGFGLPDTSYVGAVEWNSLWKYAYRSGDGSGTGGEWEDRSVNLPSAGGVFDKFTCQGSYDLVVKVKPNDTNLVFIGGTNLYRSTSGFKDKTHTTFIGGYQQGASLPVVNMYLNHHPDQHELVFFPNDPNKMLSGNDGGIFYTNDNTVPSMLWTSLNNGYMTSMFYSCAVDHATNGNTIIGGAQDNGSWFINSTDLTTPWVTPNGGDGSFCAIADSGKAFYFSTQNGRVRRAKVDGSGNVDSFARIDPRGGKKYLFINPFTIDPNNNDIMYMAGGNHLWRNDNLSGIPYAGNWDSIATNWVVFPDSISKVAGTFDTAVTAIAVSTTPANRVYIGTSYQKVFRIDSANLGTPKFKNITSSTTGMLFPNSGYVACIAVDPRNADNVMVVFSNYNVYSLFYSADGGSSWKKVAGNLEVNRLTGAGNGPSCRWASIIPVEGGTVYMVGTSVGLFATTELKDTATVWVQQGTNTIGSSVVDMIDYRSTDGLVVVATHSNGIFSAHISQVADINGVKEIAKATPDLNFKAYPNPFRGQATIQFELKERANVNISIYDGMGRLVRSIINGQADAGENKYLFAADNLPAGVYYCTLKTGTLAETRRLVLIR